jgi:hypothetical protein
LPASERLPSWLFFLQPGRARRKARRSCRAPRRAAPRLEAGGSFGIPKRTALVTRWSPAPLPVRTLREEAGPLGSLCGGEVCSRSNNHENTPHQPRFLDLPQRSAEPLAAGWSHRFEEFSSGRGLPVAQLKGMQHEAQISRCGRGFCVGCGPSFREIRTVNIISVARPFPRKAPEA